MHTLTAATVAPTLEVVRAIRDDQLTAPTPCREYDVKALVDHLLQWGPSLVGAARKEAVPPSEDVPADWRKALEAHLTELADAWSEPEAWQGVTRMGGPTEMPAATIGGMVLGEVVVHGWDLAQATGQSVAWPDEVLTVVVRDLGAMAEQGRQLGVFGPEVPVPADAPLLDRIVGLSGRNPA